MSDPKAADAPPAAEGEAPADTGEGMKVDLPEDFFYDVDSLKRPADEENHELSTDILTTRNSMGAACLRKNNLIAFSERLVGYIAGNVFVIFDLETREQKFIEGLDGKGIGGTAVRRAASRRGCRGLSCITEPFCHACPRRMPRPPQRRALRCMGTAALGQLVPTTRVSPLTLPRARRSFPPSSLLAPPRSCTRTKTTSPWPRSRRSTRTCTCTSTLA
jgi:hypothetical protein